MKTKEIVLGATLISALAGALLALQVIAQPSGAELGTSDWRMNDVGRVGLPGNAQQSGSGGFILTGAGADIWGGADAFHFVHQEVDGDFEIVGRLNSMEKTHEWAKAGVMVRSSLAENSPHAMVAMAPEKGATYIRRPALSAWSRDDAHQAVRLINKDGRLTYQQRGSVLNGRVDDSVTSVSLPRWMKLVRRGQVIQAFDSSDGQNWSWLGTEELHLPVRCLVGLAVTSHDVSRTCRAEFDSVRIGSPQAVALHAPQAGRGDGVRATYYPNKSLSGNGVSRIDPNIDFDWGSGSPVEGIGRNEFSVRWEGELEAQFTEPYGIHLISDDRARLWINGQLLIDEWTEHAEQVSTAVVNLEAGKRYLVRVEYFENRGRALARLLWSSPSTPWQPIPGSQLYSRPDDSDGDGLPDLYERAQGLDPSNPRDANVPEGENSITPRQRYARTFEAGASTHRIGAWLHQDIGQVGPAGMAEAGGGIWTVSGSGPDIWANADAFHFVYQRWAGDGELVARIRQQDLTDPWAKAGVMFRESAEAGSRHAMLAATPGHGLILLKRDQTQGATSMQSAFPGLSGPWLKLVRRGTAVSAYCSADGAKWEWIGTEDLPVGEATLVGLAVTSHDNAALGTAVFEDVAWKSVSVPSRSILQPGSGSGLLGNYFDVASGTVVTRVDPQVDFDWDTDSPVAGVAHDHFSIRWDGFVEAPNSEPCNLQVVSDDGARLWFDGTLLIDGWTDRGATADTARVVLEAGRRYALRLEYFERTEEAIAKLRWSSPSIPFQSIPEERLYLPAEQPVSSAKLAGESEASEGTGSLAAEPSKTGVMPVTESSASVAPSPTLATLPAIQSVRTLAVIPGASAVATIGRWTVDGDAIFAIDRRGGLEFDVSVDVGDIYRIELEASSRNAFDPDRTFAILFYAGDEFLGQALLSADFTSAGKVHVLTPWLKAGIHRVRVFWDNARAGRSIQVQALRLQGLEGPDRNRNGVKDWVEEKLVRENGVEGVSVSYTEAVPEELRSRQEVSAVQTVHSAVSPACIEGRGGFLSMMDIEANGNVIVAQHGLKQRWFADVPIDAGRPSDLSVSFQKGGRVERLRLAWEPTNPLAVESLTVREGDSVLLAATPDADPMRPSSSRRRAVSPGIVRIEVDGAVRYAGSSSQPFPLRFDRSGEVRLQVSLTQPDGTTISRDVPVRVLRRPSAGSPVAWVARERRWQVRDLEQEVFLESDADVKLVESSGSGAVGRQFQLASNASQDRRVVARAGQHGPILASIPINGVAIVGVSESGAFYGEEFEDGSRMVETAVIQNRLFPDVRVTLDVIVGGVMFDDGSLRKTLESEDFDETGLATVRFLMPPGVKTSNCHVMRAHQAETLIGEY